MTATGIVGTAFFFAAAFSPNLPMYGDSLVDWGHWAPVHQADARHAVGVLILAFALYLVFGVYMSMVVRGSDPWSSVMGQVALVAVGVRFAIEMMQVSVLTVPAWSTLHDFGGSMAQLGAVLSVASLTPHALFLAAVGIAALVSRAVPAWLGWFTLVVAAIHSLAMLFAFTALPPTPVLAAFGLIWFTSIPAWPLVTGVALLVATVRSRSDARPGGTVPMEAASTSRHVPTTVVETPEKRKADNSWIEA